MLRKLLPQSSYARNVITLMTGTGIAQAIPIAISPILTRLYSPQEFGQYALYMAVVAVVSVLVTGRYELAILLPRQDRDAIHIAALAAGLSVVVSAVLLVLVALLNQPMARWLGAPELAHWLYWVPASTLLMGIYQSLNYWSNRKAQYRRLAISRTVQSGTGALAQLGGGYAGAGPLGLVGGQVTGQALSTVVLARLIYREDRSHIRTLRPVRVMALAKKYKDFPRFLIVAHGFNTLSRNMPVMLLNALFSIAATGFFMLVQRVMGAPMVLVAGALGDVFRQEASQAYIHTGNCRAIYVRTFQRLLAIAILPFAVFFFSAPMLFAFVFGEQWKVAGEYAQILTPMFFLQFVTSPISQVAVIAQRQIIDLAWQISLLFFILVVFVIGNALDNLQLTLILFSTIYSIMYAIAGIINYYLSRGHGDKNAEKNT